MRGFRFGFRHHHRYYRHHRRFDCGWGYGDDWGYRGGWDDFDDCGDWGYGY